MSLYDDALAMLRRLENGDIGVCPVCSSADHDADCEINALIKKMESTPMQCRPLGTAARNQETFHATPTR